MDLVTQGLMGMATAQASSCLLLKERAPFRRVSLVGALGGLLPDADALIRSAEDPLLTLEFHRHFSHSLAFIPVGALVATLMLWPFMRRRMSLKAMYVCAFMGYATGGCLDACTSYGTHLLWPFSSDAIAWSWIAIVDPVFSLTLLAGVIWAYWRKSARPAMVSIIFVLAYLGLSIHHKGRAEDRLFQEVSARTHQPTRWLVKPTLGNIFLWRTIYEHQGHVYVDAVHVTPFGGTKLYSGSSAPLVRENPGDSERQIRDFERFRVFSKDWIVAHPIRQGFYGDVRYSMQPRDARPLWGIVLHDQAPTTFENDRELSKEGRRAFMKMILGR